MRFGPVVPRRRVLQLLVGSLAASGGLSLTKTARAVSGGPLQVGDACLQVAIDSQLRTQLVLTDAAGHQPLTVFAASETLQLKGGHRVTQFHYLNHESAARETVHGPAVEYEIAGRSVEGIEKVLILTFPERYPGAALLRVRYCNTGNGACEIVGWTSAAHTLPPAIGTAATGFWSFSGASYEDRRDWVQPVRAGFRQRNYMGMNAADYGGGTPVVDVWRRDRGLAVAHLEARPQLVALPIDDTPAGVRIAIESEQTQTLAPGAAFETVQCLLYAHQGDYFATLELYRQLMAERGLSAPLAPASAFGPIWCAWGYERNFTVAEVEGALGKVRELGFEWAVLDDGWQTSEGDWYLDRGKFPRGDIDMIAFADSVKAAGLKPRLWFSPLAVNPGTDLLHEHVDMLLLDKNGATQNVSWWNAFYLCPAYAPTVDYYRGLVSKIIGDWGYEGIKLDGQHLNAVAPCYNPAHKHAHPEESVEKLQDFWQALFQAALARNPDAVMELCPCGTSFAFHNIGAMNQTPASDPESSWQVRHKGKTLKALLGSGGSYAGDHVELSAHGRDFASTIGVGAVLSTKFTWPEDTLHPTAPQPIGGYHLTAEKEALWRQWVDIYKAKMLPKGRYLGRLYDIGFDKPEAHVIEREGRLYYAFFAKEWHGHVELRGLGPGAYTVINYVTGAVVGKVSQNSPRLRLEFSENVLLEAALHGALA
jgi:alpha-galactosidase